MEDILKDASSLEGTFDSPAIPVKWYSHEMEGLGKIPTSIDVNWGVNALDAMLVTGFNKNTTSLFEYTESTKILKVVFATNTNYLKYSVIAITGTGDAVLDTEHRVIDQGVNYFTVKLAKDPTPAALTKTGVEVKYASLGWEVAFAKGTRRVYRSKNANGPRPYIIVEGGRGLTSAAPLYLLFGMSSKMKDMYTATDDAFVCPQTTSRTFGMAKGVDNSVDSKVLILSSSDSLPANWVGKTPTGSSSPWCLIGDDRLFHFTTSPTGTGNYRWGTHTISVGDLNPVTAWDKGCTILGGSTSTVVALHTSSSWANKFLEGNHISSFESTSIDFLVDYEGYNRNRESGGIRSGAMSSNMFSGNPVFNTPSVYGMTIYLTKPKYVNVSSPSAGVSIRATINGILWSQSGIPWMDTSYMQIVEDLKGLNGAVFFMVPTFNNSLSTGTMDERYRGFFFFDILSPWRT